MSNLKPCQNMHYLIFVNKNILFQTTEIDLGEILKLDQNFCSQLI